MPLMDVKIRDLMTTAAAALREGGELLLAHEIRGDMAEVFALLEKVGSATGRAALSPSLSCLLPLLLLLFAVACCCYSYGCGLRVRRAGAAVCRRSWWRHVSGCLECMVSVGALVSVLLPPLSRSPLLMQPSLTLSTDDVFPPHHVLLFAAARDRERVWRSLGGPHGERPGEDSAVARVQRQGTVLCSLSFCLLGFKNLNNRNACVAF